MPQHRSGWSRRSHRSRRSEEPENQGSGYYHGDSRNPAHEGYAHGVNDQDDYNRDASRYDGDDELSTSGYTSGPSHRSRESDTARRPSGWEMVPYQDSSIRTTPSVSSDSTLVLEAPAPDINPPPNRQHRHQRRHRSRSRDRCYVYDDSEHGVSSPSTPFYAERSYYSERRSYRTNNNSRQSYEQYSYTADHHSYEREDSSEEFYHSSRHEEQDYSYYSDEELQRSSGGTTQVNVWPNSQLRSVEREGPSREHPGGRIIYNLRSVTLR
ncbi:hypothetical protein B0I37DRAFT_423575 [Chaetomium sp. MPI-CAGE-AT-0009]|nr:hypothetical protein B0I37DRAFT_423575 [Chaetomium sp. MPI-CAGE-AT-0009]